jgi:hypothetical protein
MKSSFVILAFMVLLYGCGQQLTEGEIIDKRHEPANDVLMFIPVAMSCGKNCTTTMLIPYWVHDDEDWVLSVKGQTKDGDTITEDWYVTEQEYSAAPIGRRESFNENTASKDDEHVKIRKA